MKIYMIRHGATKGNLEKRYVGTTDEALHPQAAEALSGQGLPLADMVYISPMRRCVETARLLYPDCPMKVVEDFRECDFGEFEYCNYEQLNGNPAYQRFIDTFGKTAFPGGEDRDSFQRRCVKAFEQVIEGEAAEEQKAALQWDDAEEQKAALQRNDAEEQKEALKREAAGRQQQDRRIALVVHGGTIMAILDSFSEPHGDYYDWQTKNGCGYVAELRKNEVTGRYELVEVERLSALRDGKAH